MRDRARTLLYDLEAGLIGLEEMPLSQIDYETVKEEVAILRRYIKRDKDGTSAYRILKKYDR